MSNENINVKEIYLKEEKVFGKEDIHMKLLNKCIRTIRKEYENGNSALSKLLNSLDFCNEEFSGIISNCINILYKSKLKEIENEKFTTI